MPIPGKIFLGVDGGGTKTALCLLTGDGNLIAQQQTLASYLAGPPGVGPAHVTGVLSEAVPALCTAAAITPAMIDFAFFGIPAYGELSADQPLLDAAPEEFLGHDRYRVDNDVVCGWAGSLAMADGINVVAGTGSIAYGRNGEVGARAGGWGELFGDEGSGYWMAIRGLQTFSQMSDGRLGWGFVGDLVRDRLGLQADFDVLDVVQHEWNYDRTKIAALSRLVTEAAEAGDPAATKIIEDAADDLVRHVTAVRRRVGFDPGSTVLVSYSGGVFGAPVMLNAFSCRLGSGPEAYELRSPRFPPMIGAALFAAGLSGSPLDEAALQRLESQLG